MSKKSTKSRKSATSKKTPPVFTPEIIQGFQTTILERYAENKRTGLPRRDSFDQYYVLVSEIMLQQTQVERVIPKFDAFISTLPDLWSLAEVDTKTLLKLWSWLGFNSRALRLRQTAQILIEEHQGSLPKDRSVLQSLPGIGAYSSASLLAFVYNISAPVVDTNIRRVLISELWLEPTVPRKWLEAVALAVTPDGLANDWNNALMDYGSIVATAKNTWIQSQSKQSKFAWSKRQVRGQVLKHLLGRPSATYHELQTRFTHTAFDAILKGMVDEGIISKQWEQYCIDKE